MKNLTNEKVLDAVIVGAGPAGLTAAIYLGRAGYEPLILEKDVPGGKMVKTAAIDNYPGYESIQGPDLSMDMYNQAIKQGAQFEYDGVVHFKKLEDGNFEIHTEGGKKYFSKVLIIATGTLENKLGIPGEDRLYGKGVSYCAVCDGAFHKDQPIAVVGGGYSAVTEGMYLTKFAKPLMVFVRKDHFRADDRQVELLKKQPNVEFYMNTVVTEVLGEDKVEAVKTKNVLTGEEKEIKVGALFPYIGAKPITEFVDDPEIKDSKDYLLTDQKLQTKIDGLYAAGDVRDVPLRQISTAVGDGSIAGQMAVERLQNLDD